MKSFIIGTVLATAPEKRCKVLSVSGGGSKGAYEVGVMQGVVENLNDEYDVFTGVSVGSINAFGFGIFDYGQQTELVEFMIDQWKGLTNDQIYQVWSKLDPVYGIANEAGFFDNSPLLDYLERMIKGKKVHKRVIVSGNDANSGSYVQLPLHEMDDPKMITSSVVGSASIPFFFPPRDLSEFGLPYLMIDGGTSWNNNLASGVLECLKMEGIEDQSQIDLDIITLNGKHLPDFDLIDSEIPWTIQYYERQKDLKSFHHDFDDMMQFMAAYPDVFYRYYF